MQTVKRMKPLHCHPCTEPISLLTGNLYFNEWSLWLISSKVWVYRSMHAHCWIARIQAQREPRKRKCTINTMYLRATYVNVTKMESYLPSGGWYLCSNIQLRRRKGFVTREVGEKEGGGVGALLSCLGCDIEYSDGGGRIQLTPFHALFFLQPLASSLKQMGVEWEEDGG